jgi:carboxypeptidase Q
MSPNSGFRSRPSAAAFALAAAAVGALACAPALQAQTFPTADPVIKRMWALGMDSSRVQSLAQVLLDSLGPRLSGTPLQKNANDWLVKTYESWGIPARNEQVGTWRGWRRGHSHIDLRTPRVRSLEGTMLGYSPGTGGKAIEAPAIVLPRFADTAAFVRWLPEARGKLVLVSAPMPTCRPVENWTANATPAGKARMDSMLRAVRAEWGGQDVRGTGHSLALGTGSLGVRLEEAGVAGVITSRPKDGWGVIDVFETYNTKAPAIALSCEDYGLVFRLAENNQHPTLRLDLDAELLGETPIFNTVGMIRGSEKPDEYVVLSAHFDSWDGGSGATDNGTGTLTMLEAMRVLKTAYPNPKRTIVVGHWTAEENGLVGSRAFSEDHPEIVAGAQAVFNQDNGTGRIVRIGGGGMVNSPKYIEAWMGKLPTEFSTQVNFNGPGSPSGGGSDDASFACHGVPAFGLGAAGWNYGQYTWHTNRDTYDKIVFDELKGNATIAAMFAYLASEEPEKISRERVDLAANAARGGAGRPGAMAWPACQTAPRKTNPRMR